MTEDELDEREAELNEREKELEDREAELEDGEMELNDREKELDASEQGGSEIDPSTDERESAFHEQVRDILGLSPFDRAEAIYAELRRLKRVDDDLEICTARK